MRGSVDKRCASLSEIEPSSLMGIMAPHLRHFIFMARPETLSSAIWYFAWQLGHENFMRIGAERLSVGAARERASISKMRHFGKTFAESRGSARQALPGDVTVG